MDSVHDDRVGVEPITGLSVPRRLLFLPGYALRRAVHGDCKNNNL